MLAGLVASLAAALAPAPSRAQPAGVSDGIFSFDAQASLAARPHADLDGGGSVSMTRGFLSTGVGRRFGGRGSVGLSLGIGRTDYDFGSGARIGGAAPWDHIDEYRVSVPVFLPLGDRATGLLIPSLRYQAEPGVSFQDGNSGGAIAGVFWKVNDRLSIGPGGGVFQEVDDDIVFFPILLIDWAITDKWRLSTGRGLGATRGPGLTLDYAVTDTLNLGLAARFEEAEFRLDDDGPAPGGTGYDRSIPLVATLDWRPRDGVAVTGFAGVAFDGKVTLKDSDDVIVARRGYDPAPIFGGTVSFDF